MQVSRWIMAVLMLLAGRASVYAQENNIAQDEIFDTVPLCNDEKGLEIKILKQYVAKPGYFFSNWNVHLGEYRNFVNVPECRMVEPWSPIDVPATVGDQKITIRGYTSFHVWTHVDCGSGTLRTAEHIRKGEGIFIHCYVDTQQTLLPFK